MSFIRHISAVIALLLSCIVISAHVATGNIPAGERSDFQPLASAENPGATALTKEKVPVVEEHISVQDTTVAPGGIRNDYSALDARTKQYLEEIEKYPLDNQAEEVDFLIGSCKDSLTRQHVAIKVYDHYINSPIMGAEAVAIHITDTWFAPGKVKMTSDIDLMNARIYADFNRQSLLGMKAPSMTLHTPDNQIVKLFASNSAGGGPATDNSTQDSPSENRSSNLMRLAATENSSQNPPSDNAESSTGAGNGTDKAVADNITEKTGSGNGRDNNETDESGSKRVSGDKNDLNPNNGDTVLYFYDIGCANCKVVTPLLVRLLKEHHPDIMLYAVYTGIEEAKWTEYRHNFDSLTKVTHLWDPDMSSDFQVKYGVLQTPRMFLIDKNGIIVGRGLEPEALAKLLSMRSHKELEYGTKASEKFWDGLIGNAEDMGEHTIKSFGLFIESSALARGYEMNYRQLTGDLLYYLVPRTAPVYRKGLTYVIDSLILDKPQVWNTADDSLKVVDLALGMKKLLSLGAVGTRVPDVKVTGTLYHHGKAKEVTRRLTRLRAGTLLAFYVEGCAHCEELRSGLATGHITDSDSRAYRRNDKTSGKSVGDEIDSVESLENPVSDHDDNKGTLKAGHEQIKMAPNQEMDSGTTKQDTQNTRRKSMPDVFAVDMDRAMSASPETADTLLSSFDLSSLPYVTRLGPKGIITEKYVDLFSGK